MAALLLPLLLSTCAPAQDGLALFRQWRRSPTAQLRIQAVRSLRGQEGPEARAALLSMLDDPHPAVRAAAREEVLARPPEEGPALAGAIRAMRSPRARAEGLRAVLERREDPSPFVTDEAAEVRRRALASGRVQLAQARSRLDHRDPVTRALALESLHEPDLAERYVRDRALEPRIAAARLLDDPEHLAGLLRDREWRVRLAAIAACERVRVPSLIPSLVGVLDGPPGRVRVRAVEALERLTGAPFGEDAARWRRWWAGVGEGYALPPPRPVRTSSHSVALATFRNIPVFSRRLCFVLDASRSMAKPAPGAHGRSRWQLVVRDLLAVLERLPSDARFNVILFRTGVEAWKPRLVPASGALRRACRAWIEGAEPEGWTNLYDALALALSDDDVDTLYLLTDGVPSRGLETKRRAILDEIAYLNRYRLVQVNCVQAGAEQGLNRAWRGFLDELADAHDGISVRE